MNWNAEKGQQGTTGLFSMLRKEINAVFQTEIYQIDIEKEQKFENFPIFTNFVH